MSGGGRSSPASHANRLKRKLLFCKHAPVQYKHRRILQSITYSATRPPSNYAKAYLTCKRSVACQHMKPHSVIIDAFCELCSIAG